MAREFDGINDNVLVADSPSISVFSGNFSIGFWFWIDSHDGNGRSIVAKGKSDGFFDWCLLVVSNTSVHIAAGNQGVGAAITTSGFTVGTWHYFLATRASGTQVDVYLDDMTTILFSSNRANGADTGDSMFIGLEKVAANASLDGRVANVIVYDRTLTQAERIQCKSGCPVPTNGLQMYLPLTGTQSPELDLTANGNNGTVTEATNVAHPTGVTYCTALGGAIPMIGAIGPITPILSR